MKHKTLLLLFLFSLLPSWGWGQTQKKETIQLDQLQGSYEINDPGEYTFTGKYKGTPVIDTNGDPKPVINVAAGLEVTIILDNVTINLSDGCPLSAKDASKVNLLLKERNSLTTDYDYPGIWAPEKTNCGIIINELNGFEGSLEVKGDLNSGNGTPGIGGFYNNSDKKGYIIINGGNINAKGGNGAAIGGALNSSGGIITINGGNINATNETYGAGIGSGENGSESEITINGGTVNATSCVGAGIGLGVNSSGCNITITSGTVTTTSNSGAGIGGGVSSSNSNITITGGIVTATSTNDAGIGNGQSDSSSTFSTGNNGTAFINASSISDPTYKASGANTKGLIFDGKKGAIYGNSYTLTADATIESEQILTITKDQTLTIIGGATLTNNGTIKCDGKINGTIDGDKKVQYAVICNLNYDTLSKEYTEYVVSGGSVPNVNRDFYEFLGWFTQSEDGDKVETITGATTVYAHWEPIPFTIKTPIDDITKTYGAYFTKELTANMFSADISNAGGLKSIELKEPQTLPDGLSFKNSTLSGIPTEVNESGTDITFVVTAGNGISKEAIIKFKVKKAELTITPHQDQKIYQDETPTYTVTVAVNNDQITFEGSLDVANNIVTLGTLALQAPFSNNYSLSFIGDIPIQTLSGNASDVLAILPPPDGENYHEEVTFTAPEGFEIALVSSVTKSDAQLAYNNNFVWDKAGTHEVTYSLRRTAGNKQAYEHSVIVTVGKVSPPDVHPDKPDNTKPVTYKVSLPSVEGIHTNPVADNYDIEAWGSFKFTITIEEGYRMLSLPIVKVNDSKIAFSSRTDTTFTYKIQYIRTPKDISITGIVKDPATANNAIKAPEENIKIINGVAYITVAKPTIFKVVEINGNITIYNLSPGVTPIYNLPKANVLLFSFDGKKAEKIIISNR